MRINVSEPEQCGCVTCVQHRSTLCIFKTKETEPSNVIGSPFTSVPVSSGPVQSSSPIRSGTETPLAPPVTTPVDSEPAQSIDSTIFNWGVFNTKNAPADASASSTSSPVQSSSPAILSFHSAVTPVTSGSLPVPVFGSPPFAASRPSIFGPMQAPVQARAPNTSNPFSFLPQQDSGKTASAYPSPFTGPPFSYNFPPAVQRPAAVYLGFNVTTYPPSAATSLPGFYCPLILGTPNFAALGTTSPAVQLYPMILATPNLVALGTTTNPADQLYPVMFGSPNLAAQGTSTPAVQPYPVMFGSPNLAAQGTSTPAVQPYPVMFGSPNLAAQGL